MNSIYRSEAGKQAIETVYRNLLQRWPVPNQQLVIPTRHGDTFIIASGESDLPPVLLLHGSGTNSGAWIGDAPELATRYRIYAVDMIGEPGLSAPSRPSLRSGAYVEWLDDVWTQLNLTRASIGGVSLGGWLALEYAVARPERVASLSLISPSSVGTQNRWFLVRVALLFMLGGWGRRKALHIVTGNANLPPKIADYLTLVFRQFRPRMEKVPIRSDAELARLTMPVQLIVGAKDVMIRSEETRHRMQQVLPNLHLVYLEKEGHILPRQTAAIAEFLGA